jgi:L-asparaginase / beta-aspartyl-peptidase
MEDSPLFNAGPRRGVHGRRPQRAGRLHHGRRDAGGRRRRRRALGAHPVLLARRVMEASPHVFLAGEGALEFAVDQGLELKPAEWFWTERRWQQLQRAQLRTRRAAAGRPTAASARSAPSRWTPRAPGGRHLDRRHHRESATARLGDVPVIGAGTWADATARSRRPATASISSARPPRARSARASAWRAPHAGEAAATVLAEVRELGGLGGVIVIDRQGRFSCRSAPRACTAATPTRAAGAWRSSRRSEPSGLHCQPGHVADVAGQQGQPLRPADPLPHHDERQQHHGEHQHHRPGPPW